MGRRVIDKIVNLRDGEAATALMMFAYSFLAMTAYNILKPITRSQFITALGADNLPYVQLGAGLVIGVVMQSYSKGAAVLPRRYVIPIALLGQAAVLAIFWLLFQTGQQWVSVAFYVLALMLGILLTSQFWTLASDIYDARQARRLFGFIGGGASLGGALGAGLTSILVDDVGTNNLLLVSAGTLALGALLVLGIVRREALIGRSMVPEERGVGGFEAVRLLRSSRHLQVIAVLIGCAAIGAAVVEQQLNMAAESLNGGSTDAMTAFLARITFYLSLVGFVVQVVLTSRVHRSMGLAFAMILLPVSLGLSAGLILWTGAVWAVGAARVLDTSLRYTIDKTTREVLFLPLPAHLRYRAKPFVDVTVDRSAKAVGALLVLVLIKPWGVNVDWRGLSAVSIAVAFVWGAMALRARDQYVKTFRRSIEMQTLEPDVLQLDAGDLTTIELLVEELAHPDVDRVLYAMDMLEMLGKKNLITPLLLHHESPAVRARTLAVLDSARALPERSIASIHELLTDESAEVRAAALHALAALHGERGRGLLRRHIDDPEPRVALAAAMVLADSDVAADVCLGESALRQRAADASAPIRRQVADALAHVENRECRELLVLLIADRDIDVARTAIRSARMRCSTDVIFVPGLLARLAHRMLKAPARDALVTYGDHACEVLARVLDDPQEYRWVRRHVPGTLARIPTQRSLDVLVHALGDPDGFLRFKALASIESLHRRDPSLIVRRPSVEQRLEHEARRYATTLRLRTGLQRYVNEGEQSLLGQALNEKLQRIVDRIFRLLALIYTWREVEGVKRACTTRDGPPAPAALEYLDNVLSYSLRARLMPLFEGLAATATGGTAPAVPKTFGREPENALALLARDEDPVIAAAAIHFAAQRGVLSPLPGRPDLPVIEAADRLRQIPLFVFTPVDELVRVASTGRRTIYTDGDAVMGEGQGSRQVLFLLERRVRVDDPTPVELEAPSVIGFEEMLAGRATLGRVIAVDHGTTCLSFEADEFIAMLADNIQLAQGLFRTLLTRSGVLAKSPVDCVTTSIRRVMVAPLRPLEKLFVVEQHPWLTGASVAQLLQIAGTACEIELEHDMVLFEENHAAGVFVILSGDVNLNRPEEEAVRAGAGTTIGVGAALAGVPMGWRATVTQPGRALRIARDDLVNLLADDADLLRRVGGAVLRTAPASRRPASMPGDVQ